MNLNPSTPVGAFVSVQTKRESVTLDGGGSWAFRRGDALRIEWAGSPPLVRYVWSAKNGTITTALGWRIWYLRLVYNPVRRVLRKLARLSPDTA